MTYKHFDSEAREEWDDLNAHIEEYLQYCRLQEWIGREPLPYGQWKVQEGL